MYVRVFVCVLVLHPFIFHSSGGSEQDLCSKCKSKWNNFIIVLWTTISAKWVLIRKLLFRWGNEPLMRGNKNLVEDLLQENFFYWEDEQNFGS